MKKNIQISKGSYILGLRCPKALHMKIHKPELALSGKENSNESLMAAGLEFENTVTKLIAPNGIDATRRLAHLDFNGYIESTELLLKRRNVNIYQATFRSKKNERVMADIIRKKGNAIELIEVKAVSTLQDYHYYDVAYQYHCITGAGIKIKKVYLAHVNKDYVRGNELTSDLVKMEDVTQKVKQLQNVIDLRIEGFRKLLINPECPDTTIGFHCTDPYPCPFKESCWSKKLPANNIFEIRGFRMKEKMNLFYRGIISMKQVIEENIRLAEPQKIQVQSTLNNQEIFEPAKIKDWLKQFKAHSGIYFLDFETIALATPQHKGSVPYEAVPVQYSVHYKDSQQKLSHYEYLADPTSSDDQRLTLVKKLIVDLKRYGSNNPVISFNKRFESGRLKYLAQVFPVYKKALYDIVERLYDLADVFRNKWHYHPDFKGSYSIKYVLPVLCPELSYNNLQVRNGGQAGAQYLALSTSSNPEQIRRALLEYCKLDTLAMVRIMESLEQKVKSSKK